MTTAVWFDLDGTIVQYERSRETMLDAVLPGAPAGAQETLAHGVYDALADPDTNSYVYGFQRVASDHNLDLDPRETACAYAEVELDCSMVSQAVPHIIQRLRSRGPVGLLTNGDNDIQRRKLSHHNIEDLFDYIILSAEVEQKKPDLAFFRLAQERQPADRYVYVGDSWDHDIAPAREAGFDTVHVRNDGGPEASVDEVSSLDIFADLSTSN